MPKNIFKKKVSKVGDIVILKPDSAHMLYDGIQLDKEQYQQIHRNNIRGKVTRLWEKYNHYFWGKYASVTWDNKTTTDLIHVSWLEKII